MGYLVQSIRPFHAIILENWDIRMKPGIPYLFDALKKRGQGPYLKTDFKI